MAKGNMLQGQATGKMGDVVFSRMNGQQIARVRNRNPKNPKTKTQMSQRVKLAAPVRFYKREKVFFPFAFQNKKTTWSDFNAFVSANLNVAPFMTKQEAESGIIIPAPYIMSKGELPSMNILKVTHDRGYNYIYFDMTDTIGGDGEPKWGGLRKYLNAEIGDMVTIAVYSTSSKKSKVLVRDIVQHIFDIEGEDENIVMINKMDISYALSDDGDMEGYAKICVIPSQGDLDAVAACVCVSRRSNGLKVSNSQLVLNDVAQAIYDNNKNSLSLDVAVKSYNAQAIALLDPAGKDTVIPLQSVVLEWPDDDTVTDKWYALEPQYVPSDASYQSLTISCDSENVEIDNGGYRFKATESGTYTIRVTASNGWHEEKTFSFVTE